MTKREIKMIEVAKLNDVRREATRRQYLENADVLDGWEWCASKSLRTCMACLFMDGMQFSLDTPFNDVRKCTREYCRCTIMGLIKGLERPPRMLGAEWFGSLPMDQKRTIAGEENV